MKRLVKVIFVFAAILLQANSYANVKADSLINKEIQDQLYGHQIAAALYFPNSVKRFYQQRKFETAWIKQQNGSGQAWQAMLMIDRVLQFGLSHADYHPNELLYYRLHDILDTPAKTNLATKARFDIMLTDAIIAFMYNVHYGKLNPNYSSGQIDTDIPNNLQADLYLNTIIDQKGLIEKIADVQPKWKEYAELQAQMHLLKGLYVGDCYDVPETDVRKIAINMERLRWAEVDGKTYIHINIPSYTLKFYQPNVIHQFKVIVGKPSTPTPVLQSKIRYFTTAPDWRVPQNIFIKELLPKALADTAYLQNNHFVIYNSNGKYVNTSMHHLKTIKKHPSLYHAARSAGCDNALGTLVFRFDNAYDVYLHDTPEQKLFDAEKRDFSHACIRVEQAEKLATLLLQNDQTPGKISVMHKAIATYKTMNFILKVPIPIKITYLTCEMKDAELITFDDVYDLDRRLEMALYGQTDALTLR